MPTPDAITVAQLSRLVGTPDAPLIVDVRADENHLADLRLLPASVRRDHKSVSSWASEFAGRSVVVACRQGLKLSQGAAAWLRYAGVRAEYLEGGFDAWREAKGLLVRPSHIPARDEEGRTVWVTRTRPKIDRVACPWLIRRFVDPNAVFLFVAPSEVASVAEQYGAAPFDIEGTFWSHRGENCTFDVMIENSASAPALLRLATIVRAADTARLDLSPEAPGFWPPRSVSRGCMTMILPNSTPAWASMTRSTDGAVTRHPKPTIGRRTSRGGQSDRRRRLGGAEGRDLARTWRIRRRSVPRVAARRGAELRRAGRTDRGHAPDHRRREEMGLARSGSCMRSTIACCCPAQRRSNWRPISAG